VSTAKAPSLAEELQTTNALLRELVTAPPEPPREPAPVYRDNFVPLSRSMPLVAVLALRSVFKAVPEDYWHIGWSEPGGTAIVTCPCEQTHRIPPGEFHECSCGRFFTFTGRKVLVIPRGS
jgi:hypothetical protein